MAPAQGLKKAIRMHLMEGGKRVSAGCCGSCRTWFFPVQPALLSRIGFLITKKQTPLVQKSPE